MENMNDLRDLLKHEVMDLYSAEEQIIRAMPAMIDKTKNSELKRALQEHLRITEQQRSRLDQVQRMMGDSEGQSRQGGDRPGLFNRLMNRRHVCKGMQGIIAEGTDIMSEDMSPEVMDAAIIACAQKIEHYEICGYGTARAFARELNMNEVADLLEQTLNEEYEADERLTALAVGRVNVQAERGGQGRTAGAAGGGGRMEGGRTTTRERARMEEPEMEMASRSRGTTGSTRGGTTSRTGTTGRGSASTGSTGRTTSGASGGTTARTGSKSTGRSTGTSGGTTGGASGRSGSSRTGGARGR